MTEYNKFNIVYRLQKWMDSVPGQTFLNYAYSWGASIVILGTLFKLTHLPGANTMLFIGMGTEVFVFFLSAFDRPFDKTAEGRDLPTHVTEAYLEGETNDQPSGSPLTSASAPGQREAAQAVRSGQPISFGHSASQTRDGFTATGQSFSQGQQPGQSQSPGSFAQAASSGNQQSGSAQTSSVVSEASVAAQPVPNYVPQMSVEEAQALNEAQGSYVEELKKLVDTLGKVNEQSTRLTRDSEEMENLNRTLTGISKIYEMQLKGASQQVGTIDQINDQTRKMAQQIEQLNKIYARMIEAMTVNMHVAAPNAGGNPSQNPANL